MKYWCPNDWSDSFDHEGLLFFIQKMQEMLFHFSDDIHRAPVHNTSTLAHEFLRTHVEVTSGKIGKYQLKAIFEEFRYSFSHDKILKENLGLEFVDQVCSKLNSCQEHEYFDLVNYIYKTIKPNYLRWTVTYLKEHIPQGTHKQEISIGARCWIADIIMRGYSGEFIYRFLEDLFIKGAVHSIDILDTFFSRFNFKKRKYKVYLYVSNSVVSYSEMLNKRLSIQFEDDGNFGMIKPPRRYTTCYLEIDALDYYTAAIHAYHKVNIFFMYYRFLSNQRRYMLNRMGYVFETENAGMHSLPIIPTGLKAIEIREDEAIVRLLDAIILGIQDHSSKSLGDLNKAIELHNSALRQQLPKDGLANLWSILEVLCPKTETESKLDIVLRSSLPVLQNDYFPTVFQSINDDLHSNVDKDDLNQLLSKIQGDDEVFKAAAFCLLPEYESLREEYFKKWSNLPLLRDKIFNIYQLRNDKSALFTLSDRYAQRVKWHLYRLYRARNAIVHSGDTHSRIQVLSEHLHAYVDSITCEIAFKLSEDNALNDISSVFVDTQFLVKSKKEHFKDTGIMTSDDISFLLRSYFIESNP